MADVDQSIAASTQINATIRQARADEAGLLTALTLRSKAHWGYDTTFMADAVEDLTFRVDKFQPDFHVYVLEEREKVIGFCSLIPIDDNTVELFDLFVEPEFIGKAYGKKLWDHAVAIARRHHFKILILTADPFAEAFYLRQGATRTGEKASNIRPDRVLPLMNYAL